jgi:hypothetical protein
LMMRITFQIGSRRRRKIFCQNEGKDFWPSEKETIRNKPHSLPVSRAMNNLSRLQLIQERNFHPFQFRGFKESDIVLWW